MVKEYFKIQAKGDKHGEIIIYEEIGDGWYNEGMGAKRFSNELRALGDVTTLDIRINSVGGSVFEGTAIYNILRMHAAQKNVYIDGIAASIASVIAMAGDTIHMPENSYMMIHNPFSFCVGDAEEMRKMAEALDKLKDGIVSAYVKKTGMSAEQVALLMDEETWMMGSEAVEKGFADKVIDAVKIAAKYDLSIFSNTPQQIKNSSSLAALSSSSLRGPGVSVGRQTSQAKTMTAAGGEIKNTTTNKEVKTMGLECENCGTILVGETCPRCDIDAAKKAAAAQAKDKELARIKGISQLAREYKCAALGATACDEGWTEEQFKNELLKRIKENARNGSTNPLEGLRVTVEPAHEGKPFRSFGEQLLAIKASAKGNIDHRLLEIKGAVSGASETVDSDGAFLIQPDFTTMLLQRSNEVEVLAPLCTEIPVSGNRLEAPVVDESSRATGSRWGGVQVYRTNEADTVAAKKPKLGKLEMKLEKLMGIFYSTEELLEDASALEAIAAQAFAEEIAFRTDDEILNGNGAGQMLGILNAPALVSQAKETGQAAATIVAENIIKMYSRMPARSKSRAKWFINSEIMPQLMTVNMTIGTAGVPLFMPPGGISSSPYGMIFGRPVVEIEQAAALGTIGDILFADLSQYAIITKGGIRAAQSMHVRFLYDEMCYKWTLRNNGQPIWKTALTPYKGTQTVSPYVALATRA